MPGSPGESPINPKKKLMKNQMIHSMRLAAGALAACALCLATPALGQRTNDASALATPEPNRVGSMAPTGAKPSKAELEKMEAEKKAAPGAKPATATTTATAQVSATDRSFMMEASVGNMKEVHMGQMAVKNSTDMGIKKLGTQIAADHSKANEQLMSLAQSKGVKLDPKPKMKMDKLDKANFDKEWLAMMEKDHREDIAAFEKAAKTCNDKDLKSWAKKTLPTLKKHLKMVQDAQKKMGARSS